MLPSRYRARITWLCGANSLAFVTEDGVSEPQVANAAQLFNNYGPKANEEFLMGYGFSMEDNPQVGEVLGSACHTCRQPNPSFGQDWVAIKASFGGDPQATLKQTILDLAGLERKHFLRRNLVPPGKSTLRRRASLVGTRD